MRYGQLVKEPKNSSRLREMSIIRGDVFQKIATGSDQSDTLYHIRTNICSIFQVKFPHMGIDGNHIRASLVC